MPTPQPSDPMTRANARFRRARNRPGEYPQHGSSVLAAAQRCRPISLRGVKEMLTSAQLTGSINDNIVNYADEGENRPLLA
jgi:hypothetical protein